MRRGRMRRRRRRTWRTNRKRGGGYKGDDRPSDFSDL